jgi:hypothetical protein
MDPNRQKQEPQKPAHQQQRRSIVEGMARTGIQTTRLLYFFRLKKYL